MTILLAGEDKAKGKMGNFKPGDFVSLSQKPYFYFSNAYICIQYQPTFTP